MAEDQRAKRFSLWMRVLFLFFCGTAAAALAMFSYGSNEAMDVVVEQLNALNAHHISQAYYEYTAEEFQNTTSLPQFKEFLKKYPALSSNRSYQLEMGGTDKDHAYVTGRLVSRNFDEMKGEWMLEREDGGWKIVGITLTDLEKDDEEQLAIQEMVDFAEKQLRLLNDKGFVEAYYGFVSKDFQKETSLENFETFVKNNPILFSYRRLDVEDGRMEKDRGYVTLSLEGPKGKYLLEYILTRESEDWKVFGLHLILPNEVAAEKMATNPDALVPPVRSFLDALVSSKPDKAYQLTSKEFRDSTSIGSFQVFVDAYPALSERELVDFKKGKIESGTGTQRVNLHDADGITSLEFSLGFFEGEWMIWGVEVLNSPMKKEYASDLLNAFNQPDLKEQLLGLLRQQIKYLHHQDIDEAYQLMMSANYRLHHSIYQFEEFFRQFPIFLDHRSIYFNRFLRSEGQAVLRGYLTTFDDVAFPVRIDFVQEPGGWKIDGIVKLDKHDPIADAEEVLDKPADDLPPKPPALLPIVMGTEVNEKGVVTNPVKILESGADPIYFNISIVHGQSDTTVTLVVEHADSGTTTPSLSTMLQKEGKSMISFSYRAPKNGWPPGDYIAKVTTSSGQEALFKFRVFSKSESKS